MAVQSSFNAIELEILWKRLISVVDEAAAAFVRTCFSTLVRDGNDFAIVLTDAQGRSLAQSTMSLPGFIGCLPATVRHFMIDQCLRDHAIDLASGLQHRVGDNAH